VPPERLRVRVGPFSDATLFQQSGDQMVAEIINLCAIRPGYAVVEVGCGCGRLSRPLGDYLTPPGSYDGMDVSVEMIDWCQRHLSAPNCRFARVDVRSPDQNPEGSIEAAALSFPYGDCTFDVAIVSSVFTHIMPGEIERYVSELARVLKTGGRCFITAFLMDEEAEAAVATGATIFDFRHPVGSCLTFEREHPEAGIACRRPWMLGLLDRAGFEINTIRIGTWRTVRSYKVTQDYVVATKRVQP
jgi:ubiquinone/menaquinone biosynthesis C-methylase UbiE